ncbi:hypothetical protein JCM8097_008054 [Rhodosporidiobolus ruineniae]
MSAALTLKERSIPPHLPRDILAFLLSYPHARPNPKARQNALFYQDKAPARPRRSNCEELQGELRGNWDELEHRHDFIQWFFPIREQGVNWDAQPLELHEIGEIKADPKAMERLMESYRIILAFYGLRLVSPVTGELAVEDSVPAPNAASYLRRFRNLEQNPHNFLRMTRILKCLGEFGLTQHPPSLLLFLLALQSDPSAAPNSSGPHLSSPSLVRSMDGYWRWCVRDDADRKFVVGKVDEVRERGREGGGWTGEEYREWVKRRAEERAKAAEEKEGGAAEEPLEKAETAEERREGGEEADARRKRRKGDDEETGEAAKTKED